jgi:hypothetical protein
MANPKADNFDAWLGAQKPHVCAAIAIPAALRAFPLIHLEFHDKDMELSKSISNKQFLNAVRGDG